LSSERIVHLKGNLPILITVPHKGVLRESFREDSFMLYRDEEVGVEEIAREIKRYLDVHVLINEDDMIDVANPSARNSPYRQKIEEIKRQYGIKFILDLHGTSDVGLLHAEEHVGSSALDPAISYALSKYQRHRGPRPDVDLEFRRRARTNSCTCTGAIVQIFKQELLNLGLTVGIEAAYIGGDIIGYHSDVNTQALAMEIVRSIRDIDEEGLSREQRKIRIERRNLLIVAIVRALCKIFNLQTETSLRARKYNIPHYEEIRREDLRRGGQIVPREDRAMYV